MSNLNPRSRVYATKEKLPQLEEIEGIVKVALVFDLSVCLICFTQDMHDHWQLTLEAHLAKADPAMLDVIDLSRATLADWTAHLQTTSHYLTILSGARAELQADRLSAQYVGQLVGAISAETVILG